MKVAAVQMISGPSLVDNLASAQSLVNNAAAQGAELVVLPEYFCLIGDHDADKLAVAEPHGKGPLQAALATLAKRHGIWLVGGTIPLATTDASKVTNSVLAFDPAGHEVCRYDKIHLFKFDNGVERYDESRVLQAGTTVSQFRLPSIDGHVWSVGLSVCYDLRFAELYRQLACDLLLVPAAFTYGTGQAHWEILLRARAIENLAYVLASAQGGTHPNGRRTFGESMAISPWGEVINRLQQGPGLVVANLDFDQIGHHRQQLPALSHRVLTK
jgi:deaminated glutathione amidase